MLTQYTAQATKPGYSAALYRAYRAVGGGAADEGSSEPPDPFALVTARVEEELKSPLQNMLGVNAKKLLRSCALFTFFFSQGDLMQLLLIQTQVMKVDMEERADADGPDNARK